MIYVIGGNYRAAEFHAKYNLKLNIGDYDNVRVVSANMISNRAALRGCGYEEGDKVYLVVLEWAVLEHQADVFRHLVAAKVPPSVVQVVKHL